MQPTPQPLGRRARALGIAAVLLAVILCLPAQVFAGRVFVDPGHGGRFPGATYDDIKESDIALAISLELDRQLRARGHETAMSRRSDTVVVGHDIPTWNYINDQWRYAPDGTYTLRDDLQARCDLANSWGADVFVSIHANAATSTSARGAETYWSNLSTTDRLLSAQLATYVQQEYIKETGLNDRGVKTAQFYVLRWSNMPAILVETGFMSNSTERGLLTSPSFQRKAAVAIARGIDRFLATDPFGPVYPRIAGNDRYETATLVAQRGWGTSGSTVILASGLDWPDSLAGTPLSRRIDAPLLLAEKNWLPPATRDHLASQRPTRIVILGGESVLSTRTVAAAVGATGRDPATVDVERFSGEGRFDTAADIARHVGVPTDGRVFVASGREYADALSIGSYAGADGVPILLVEPTSVPPATRAFIAENASRITRFELIGGTAAVSQQVEGELRATAPVVRTWGPDRYRTNLAVVSRFGGSGSLDPIVARATAFPDALTAATFASKSRRPVLLVGERYLSPYTREFLHMNRSRIADPTVVGGPAAVTYQMDWMVRKGFAR